MWNHFMIKIEWVEELLRFVLKEKVETWMELFREMSIYSGDRNFAYMSFKSIKKAFSDFELAESNEEQKIELINKKVNLREHLQNLAIKRTPDLMALVEKVTQSREVLDFEKWKSLMHHPKSESTSKREYIQQLEFLQYLGFGVTLDRFKFMLFKNLEKDILEPKELMKIVLRYKDPRVLGYKYSQHPDGDKLGLSFGKDFLTLIPSGSDLNHIDSEAIFSPGGGIDSFELDRQLEKFRVCVYKESGFGNEKYFDDMIFTLKYCFDAVFYGRSTISKELIETKRVDFLEKILEKKNLKLTQYKKKEFETTFRTVSKLNFNSVFLNRYLHRPASRFSIIEPYLDKDPRDIDVNLRMLKGNASLKAIFSSVNTIYKLSSQLAERKQVVDSKLLVKQIQERTSLLLPEDLVERKKQLDILETVYYMRRNVKTNLMKIKNNFTGNGDCRLVELSPFINFLNNERFRQNKIIAELENIRKFLTDLYSKNLLELGYQTKIEYNHLNKFNLMQILNMLDDQKNQLEKSRKMANNRELIELLRSLLEDTKNDLEPQTETFKSQNNRLRFAIEKLVGQFKSYSK